VRDASREEGPQRPPTHPPTAPVGEPEMTLPQVATPTAAIRLRGIRQSFGEVVALVDVSFTTKRHERLGIVGPSGCGKSTLLSAIAGLIQPDEGTVTIDEATTPRERLRRCALMPQRDLLLPWRTAIDNAAIALENRGMKSAQARERARPLFERFGLAEFEERMPAQLSGGMRQRVAFLRTIMAEKDILLLDEPFAALDSITRSSMQEWLLSALEQEARTVLLVTHDVDEALLLTHRVIVMSARPGRIVRTLETDLPRDRPRREIVTSPEFAALKESALEALEL
jgi:ABC-type nitrate/sulfonate/bicarbonate transport system ATPase subunit